MASGRKKSNANAVWIETYETSKARNATFRRLYQQHGIYPASLELHKIYRVITDEDAAQDGDIRVVDESGEDYLYPASWFAMVKLPQEIQDSVLRAA